MSLGRSNRISIVAIYALDVSRRRLNFDDVHVLRTRSNFVTGIGALVCLWGSVKLAR